MLTENGVDPDDLTYEMFGNFTSGQVEQLGREWFPIDAIKQGKLQNVWRGLQNHAAGKMRPLILLVFSFWLSSFQWILIEEPPAATPPNAAPNARTDVPQIELIGNPGEPNREEWSVGDRALGSAFNTQGRSNNCSTPTASLNARTDVPQIGNPAEPYREEWNAGDRALGSAFNTQGRSNNCSTPTASLNARTDVPQIGNPAEPYREEWNAGDRALGSAFNTQGRSNN